MRMLMVTENLRLFFPHRVSLTVTTEAANKRTNNQWTTVLRQRKTTHSAQTKPSADVNWRWKGECSAWLLSLWHASKGPYVKLTISGVTCLCFLCSRKLRAETRLPTGHRGHPQLHLQLQKFTLSADKVIRFLSDTAKTLLLQLPPYKSQQCMITVSLQNWLHSQHSVSTNWLAVMDTLNEIIDLEYALI